MKTSELDLLTFTEGMYMPNSAHREWASQRHHRDFFQASTWDSNKQQSVLLSVCWEVHSLRMVPGRLCV